MKGVRAITRLPNDTGIPPQYRIHVGGYVGRGISNRTGLRSMRRVTMQIDAQWRQKAANVRPISAIQYDTHSMMALRYFALEWNVPWLLFFETREMEKAVPTKFGESCFCGKVALREWWWKMGNDGRLHEEHDRLSGAGLKRFRLSIYQHYPPCSRCQVQA